MTALRNAHPGLAEQAADRADPAERPWSAEQMLLAALIDAVRQIGWMYASTHAKDKGPPKPDPIPRPGVTARQRKTLTVAKYRQMTGEDPPLHLVEGAG